MSPKFFEIDSHLHVLLNTVLKKVWSRFPLLMKNQISVCWVIYQQPCFFDSSGLFDPEFFSQGSLHGASYRGDVQIYPASVVKLFYLVAAHAWLEKGSIRPTSELNRAMRDMIVDSSNDATSYIVDVLTNTTSGPELAFKFFREWEDKRNSVNRYFKTWQWPELDTVNVNHKTWGDGPYGRERAFLGKERSNRNLLTTEATARLMHSMVCGTAVSPERSLSMLNIMKRDLSNPPPYHDGENQVSGFLGNGLPRSGHIFSKAGWTSHVRHDAAYINCEGCYPYLLVVFVDGSEHSANRKILPLVSSLIYETVKEMSA